MYTLGMHDVVNKQEVRLADYRPASFAIPKISLDFQIFPSRVEVSTTSVVHRLDDTVKTLCLNGGPYMKLMAVSVDGQCLESDQYEVTSNSLRLPVVSDSFELCIVTELLPRENTRLEGLYQSGENLYTQCEAEGFRHITYFLDRPDILTKFDVRIEADKGQCPILLSNGNPGLKGDLPAGRHYAEWHDPFPKPCYLFALVAGKFACNSGSFQTASGIEVALHVFVEANDLSKSDHALASLQKSMAWDEATYGLEYDLEVYNIVAVSDFNMGAMENKGLNIFNTKYVLASPETATDDDFDRIEGVIGHEYFHNWSGNRVTCRDWFQLSLKEGLTVYRDQEFSSDIGSRFLKRLDDIRMLRMLQFTEDAGPLAHSVRPDKYVEINNFYTATVYNKGAELIRMIHLIVGKAGFRRGLDLYFERHDGQAVTCEHFLAAIEDATGVDLGQFSVWYTQAGTPRLTFSREKSGDSVALTVEQSCPPTPGQPRKRPLHIPILVGWLDANGKEIQPVLSGGKWRENGCLLELRKARQTFVFHDVPKGAVPSILRGFSAPIICETDFNAEELAFLMLNDNDTFARWEASQILATKSIIARFSKIKNVAFETKYRAVFSGVLRDHITDPAAVAELLTLPSEIEIGQSLPQLDAAGIKKSRDSFLRILAKENRAEIVGRYEELTKSCPYDLRLSEKSRRKLRNSLLVYIAAAGDAETYLLSHYKTANNMTEKLAALNLISDSKFSSRDTTLLDFYETWKDDALVVDKWFAVQANSSRADVVGIVQKLVTHEAFSLQNPNRVRSLVSTFAMGNQAGFHSKGGEGYQFLSDMIIQVDKYNPQTAARLVAPLGRWARLAQTERLQMKRALEHILRQDTISDDVREMCSKSIS